MGYNRDQAKKKSNKSKNKGRKKSGSNKKPSKY